MAAPMYTPNQLVLQEVGEIQHQTRESLQRIQQQVAETDIIGSLTLASLDEQRNHVDRISKETNRLNDSLDKTKKLQYRFAAWSLGIGSLWKARKLARTERHEEKLLRRIQNETSRSCKNVDFEDPSMKNDAWLQENTTSGSDDEEEEESRNRLELFGTPSCKQVTANKTVTTDPGLPSGESPITDDERRCLCRAQAEDQEIDSELEIISRHVDELLSAASTMSREINKQASTLDCIAHEMEKANEKQRTIGHRARLVVTRS